MKAIQLEKINSPSVILLLATNGALLVGQVGALIGWVLKDSSHVNFQQATFLSVITVLSFFGFSLKSRSGWLLTALPAISQLFVHLVNGSKINNFGLFPSLMLFIVFNSVIAIINTKEYQKAFNLSGKELLLMNCMAFGISALLVAGFMNLQVG